MSSDPSLGIVKTGREFESIDKRCTLCGAVGRHSGDLSGRN